MHGQSTVLHVPVSELPDRVLRVAGSVSRVVRGTFGIVTGPEQRATP